MSHKLLVPRQYIKQTLSIRNVHIIMFIFSGTLLKIQTHVYFAISLLVTFRNANSLFSLTRKLSNNDFCHSHSYTLLISAKHMKQLQISCVLCSAEKRHCMFQVKAAQQSFLPVLLCTQVIQHWRTNSSYQEKFRIHFSYYIK